jgi:hypothetical protein
MFFHRTLFPLPVLRQDHNGVNSKIGDSPVEFLKHIPKIEFADEGLVDNEEEVGIHVDEPYKYETSVVPILILVTYYCSSGTLGLVFQ